MIHYQTICLYKRNIPFSGHGLDSRQYFTFGHYDAMDILPEKPRLKELHEECQDVVASLDGLSTVQLLLLARDDSWQPDDDFVEIEQARAMPLVFVALLNRKAVGRDTEAIASRLIDGTTGYGETDLDDWQNWIAKICKHMKGKTQDDARPYRFAFYYPLNISQGALRIHASQYTDVVMLLADLQRQYEDIQYSFTISGLNNSWIADSTKLPWTEYRKLSVSFDIVANRPGNFCGLVNELNCVFCPDDSNKKECFRHEESIGSVDVRLTYDDVTPGQLLQAYRTVITPSCEHYAYGAASLISSWFTPMDGINPFRIARLEGLSGRDCREPDRPGCRRRIVNRRALHMLQDATRMLERSQYMHYIDVIVKPALTVLLDIISEYMESDKTDEGDFNDSINRFLQYSQDLLTSALRSDQQFFEAPGFNMVLEETPLKLLAVYNACLYEIRAALVNQDVYEQPDNARRYAFLVHPSMEKVMTAELFFLINEEKLKKENVKEENPSKGKTRLYHIALPHREIQDLRKLLPQLAHEMGHCIYTEARKRQERYQSVLKLVSRILALKLYPDAMKLQGDGPKAIIRVIREHIDRFIGTIDDKDSKKFYMRNLRIKLKEAVKAALMEEELHKKILTAYAGVPSARAGRRGNGGYLSVKQFRDLQNMEDEARKMRFLMISCLEDDDNCDMIVDYVLSLVRESYADIVMILALGMTPDEYLLSFKDALSDVDFLKDRALFDRINSVIRVMSEQQGWASWIKDLPGAPESLPTYKLPPEDQVFLFGVRNSLNDDDDGDFTSAICETIDKYLVECRESLLNHKLSQRLLTEELYHESFHIRQEDHTLNIIQQLLMRTGGEF